MLVPPALAARASAPAPLPALPLFEVHSGFWMNLHHLLHEQARRAREAAGHRSWGPPKVALFPDGAALPAADRAVWDRAVEAYAGAWADKDLLDDEDLTRAKAALAGQEGRRHLVPGSLPEGLQVALESAAPVYRARGWAAQDAANRAWIRAQAPEIRRLGLALARTLGDAFGEPWPKAKVRVDLVPLAGWAGAYTTTGPAHVVVATGDPRDQGDQGFEILFHESAHILTSRLEAELAEAGKRLGKPVPADLWHAVLFWTVGRATSAAVPEHVPYAEVQKLWARAWPAWRGPIARCWGPFLEGKRGRAEALDALVSEAPAEGR